MLHTEQWFAVHTDVRRLPNGVNSSLAYLRSQVVETRSRSTIGQRRPRRLGGGVKEEVAEVRCVVHTAIGGRRRVADGGSGGGGGRIEDEVVKLLREICVVCGS